MIDTTIIKRLALGLLTYGLLSQPSAAMAQGTLEVWGVDNYGLVSARPAGDDFVQVSMSFATAIALRADGTLASWGEDYFWQGSRTPVGNDFGSAARGDIASLALRRDATLVMWGDDPDIGVMDNMPEGSDFISISAKSFHFVGLRSNGRIEAWGDLWDFAPETDDVVAIAAGAYHGLALREDGSLLAWGYDEHGEVSDTPTGNDFVAVACGSFTSLALHSDGRIAFWGQTYGKVAPSGSGYTARERLNRRCLGLPPSGELAGGGADSQPLVTETPPGKNYFYVAGGDWNLAAIRRSAPADTDGDGLTDIQEGILGTSPTDPDSDDDGLLDGTEVEMAQGGGCPNPLDPDSDDDGLLDGAEVTLGTSPCNADTDGDGLNDSIDPTPLVPGAPGSFIEASLRQWATTILSWNLGLFDAPNANAAKGRRTAISNKMTSAANLLARGDRFGAIDELTSLLTKLDGDQTPPDWVVDSPEKQAFYAQIQLLIRLLGMP